MTFAQLLGSMRFAISMLAFVGIASIIGTILKQNEPYESYIIKFGQFWFNHFEILNLYNVYQAIWFIAILLFLIASTSYCIYQNTPGFIRDIKELNVTIQEKSLQSMKYSYQVQLSQDNFDSEEQRLKRLGFKVRCNKKNDAMILSAKKGHFQKLGYFFTHLAIIVISVGGLMDANIWFIAQERLGIKNIESRDLPLSQIPLSSRLDEKNAAFRANVLLTEGEIQDVAILPLRDGYLVQDLPFRIALKDFNIKHYSTGQPKSFESDVIIVDKKTGQQSQHNLSVNKPLTVNGISIYQSDFQDGGSTLDLKVWDLASQDNFYSMKSEVFKVNELAYQDQKFTLEFDDFRAFNVLELEDKGKKSNKNVGPSFVYKMRNASGQAVEYQNYQLPMKIDGDYYFMSGMRESQQDEYKYLKIPADSDQSVEGFMIFKNLYYSKDEIEQSINTIVKTNQSDVFSDQALFKKSLDDIYKTFISKGYSGIAEIITQNIPEDQQTAVANTYIKIIFLMGANLINQYNLKFPDNPYFQFDNMNRFIQDALNALSDRSFYGANIYLELSDFQQIQASGFQLTKAPGKSWVYLGSIFLVIGIFCMIYIQETRLWIIKKRNQRYGTIAFATNRDHIDYEIFTKNIMKGLGYKSYEKFNSKKS